MSDEEMESLSCEEEDDQKTIFEHNEYLAKYLPGLIYAIKTCAREGDLKSLNLGNLDLAASHLREFFNFIPNTQITELSLEMNDLRWGMQQFVKQLIKSKVRKLNLKHCEIQKDEVLQLMQTLKNTQITDLDLSCLSDVHLSPKLVTTFVSHLLKSHVTRLNLASTSIMEGGLGKQLALSLLHTSITYLDLSHSLCHNKEALMTLFTSLLKTSVTELLLGGNEITDNDLKPLCQNLAQTKLEVLVLHFNKITDNGVNMLTEALINSKVRELGMSINKIKGANNLGRHLKETKISVLNFGMNKIESYEIFSFPNFLKGSSVTELDVDRCSLGDAEGQKLMKCLKSSEVTRLNIEGNKLGLPAVTEFAKILKDTSITEVNFSDNNLSLEAFQILGDGLKGSKLQKFIAQGNYSNTQDGSAVAAFIDKTRGTALDSLNIKKTNFQNSVEILATSLTNTTITNLNISSCKIGTGITDLALSLKHTAITHLDLSENEIGNQGAETLADCLKDTQIVDLDVSNNSIKTKGAKALLLCLKTTNLYRLNLGHNKITDNGIAELAGMLEGTFVTDVDVDYNEGCKTLPLLTVLWKNRFLVHKLVSFFKSIMPVTSDGPLRFGRNIDGDFTKYVERCLLFYKAVIEQPSAISALVQEESLSLSRKQIAKLVLEEYPSQFASFVGSTMDVEVAQHVRFLEKAEECKLSKIVEHLLINLPVLMIEKKLGILHPAVYKLLVKYNLKIETEDKNEVIRYFAEHPDVAGASDVIKILSN